MLDFTLIKTGEDFEFLCEDLLRKMGFEIKSRPARGPDQGKDMIAVLRIEDKISLRTKEEYYLVECKHRAIGGKSVTEDDVKNIVERVLKHKCRHYLLITSATLSETVKNQIEGISESSDTPIEASFWNKHDLDKWINEHSEVWKHHTGQQIPKKITSQIFKAIDSVLDRSSEFFPNRTLFKEDLVYFPDEEHQIMQQIQTILSSQTGDRIALLCGDPASGKTVMGFAIAKEMEKQEYKVLYHRLTAETKFDAIWSNFTTYGGQKVLFVLDDCHLNLEIATEVYFRFDSIQKSSCLLISRNLPKNLRFIEKFDYLDIFEKLENEDRSFELDIALDQQVINKISGIIQRYKDYYERTSEREFVVGNEEQIIQNTHHNFLYLYFYLFFWKEIKKIKQLDQLDEKQILDKIYDRYLGNNTYKPYMELILKYAALYQYEIQFEPSKEEDSECIEFLTKQGLLEFNTETEYYAFYHSDFAKLIVKSYASRPSFKRKYHSGLQQFTIQQIKNYILSFEDYPSNLSEVFVNIIINKSADVFSTLLEDESVADRAIRFYKNTDSVVDLVRFLRFLELNYQLKLGYFLEHLVMGNTNVKTLFLETENVFAYFVSLLEIIADFDRSKYETFLSMFNSHELKDMLINSSLLSVSSAIYHWCKFDSKSAKTIFSPDDFIEKAKKASFIHLGISLSNLYNVNAEKTREIFQGLELNELIEKAKKASFIHLGISLSSLYNVNAEETREIFQGLELNELIEEAEKASFIHLGESLSKLYNINAEKTREIFQGLELNELIEEAKKANFINLGNSLSNLYNVNAKKTREIFQGLELNELIEEAKKANFINLGNSLSNLYNVNADKAQKIFQGLELDKLIEEAEKAGFINLGNSLNALYNVNADKAQKILQGLELDKLIEEAEKAGFIQLGTSLNALYNVNADKAQKIFQSMELNELIEEAKKASFIQLGTSLNDLYNVNADKAQEIFQSLELNELIGEAKRISFINLGGLLSDLYKVDAEKTREIFQSLELNELIGEAKRISFINLGGLLSDLYKVDAEKTREIFQNLELDKFIEDASKMEYSSLLIKLCQLVRINPAKIKDFIAQLSNDHVIQFKYLDYLPNFNNLFFTLHTCGCLENVRKLAVYAQENMEVFLRSKSLKDIANLFNNCAYYFDIENIILQNYKKWFGKVKYGEPSEIPYFIHAINNQNTEVALELFDDMEKKKIINDENILTYCYYELGVSFAELEDYTESTAYLKKAVSIFKRLKDDKGLCLTNFALAKNALESNKTQNARKLAEEALSYSRNQGMRDLQEEIEIFIETKLHKD
jgi:hypothetical protein